MVYIPYFLYRHRQLDTETLKKIQFIMPGHINADVFVAQGDSFCKTYNRSKNRDKMVVLGSPKCDNIYWQMSNYPRYPEWDEATAGKNVFLLNTHYSAVTTGAHKAFLPFILETIEQNEDLALIWRPHPQSFLMFGEKDHADLFTGFRDCLHRVLSHPRMILDRTASDVSALMYCSAVLTQESSIIAESIFADKPVFLLFNNPDESFPKGIMREDILKRLAKSREYDRKNLFLYSAVDYYGYEDSMPEEVLTEACFGQLPLLRFIEDVRSGVDRKKQLRGFFREQSFANLDGTCGRHVHDYIANLLK
jgi:hypothetical protein